MKLALLLMCAATIQVSAMTFGQTITLKRKNAKMVDVLQEIQEQSGYHIFYDSALVPQNLKLDVDLRGLSLQSALSKILTAFYIDYNVVDKNVILTESKRRTAVHRSKQSPADISQQAVVKGRVSNVDGIGLANVSVAEKHTDNLAATDERGNFELRVSKWPALLVFSSVGFQRQELTVSQGSEVVIEMVPAITEMDEVVVVGYGTQRRSDLTGSVSSIKGEQLSAAPIGQLSNSLQGLSSGLEIVSGGGSPAEEPTIQIRGTGSVNSSNPLVVIDGVPSGKLTDINPNDIEQIEVLKDASSAAIYGTRAANGVILVTTKRGKFGQPTQYSVNLYSGITNVNNKLDLLGAEDLVMLKKERYTNDGIAANVFWDDPYYAEDRTDWQDELFQAGRLENFDLSIRGGGEKSSYLTSLGYYNEKGIMLSSKFRRLSARVNSNHVISDKLKLVQNFQYNYRNWYNPSTSSVYSGVLWQALRFNPAIPVMDENGEWGTASANNELGDINNPVYELSTEDRTKRNHNMLASMTLEYAITDDLKWKGNIGFEGNLYQSRDFFPSVTQQMRRRNDAELGITNQESYTVLGETYIDYRRAFGSHHLDAVAGVSMQSRNGSFQTVKKIGYADESLDQIVFDNGATMNSIIGNYDVPQKLASAFARLNYSYANRYLLTMTMRGDGSSKFMPGRRWGYFPGFSAGWRISEEDFMADISFLDDLKIKAGWGMLGNQEVADLQYLTIIKRNIDYGNKYTFGADQVGGSRITSLANPFITWEKTAMTNLGVDAVLFQGGLTANVAWFDKRTSDMLIPAVVMGTVGRATIPDSNIGEMRNWGWEIELTQQKQLDNGFAYNVGFNLTFLKNKVTKLYGNNNYIGSVFYGRQSQEISRTYEDMPLASFFGWKSDGLYQNQAEIDADVHIQNDERKADIKPGDVRFVDINGDGQIDEQDRVYLGDPNPDAILGLQLGVGFKGWMLHANLTGSFGGQLYNADRMQGLDPTYSYNMYAEALGRWHGEGTSNTIPRMSTQRTNLNHRTSDLFIENGNFVKLKTLTLSYKIPTSERSLFRDMNVYVMGENLFVMSAYKGYNPEIGYSDGNLQRGVDYANFPFSRKINLGLRFDF
ncbi:SusC/RagA family TonB-linked outer membrane protein [Sphingobacterium sp. SGR-19]|uniref:SusC/RagA family TonB-linked outer membrane protein n=1 Tax=Sphingobacterium sp. SGR-19 TaxID=2710886 RepID=UPI0013EDC777|nr:TonB-dependent receptor [Sphingobacterium sp. SGR-19]NGM67066.1 TonB-dependent receptor [Sphingobacterium sp. SGR-19]